MADCELDFQLLFEESPDVLLVLLPDTPRFTMVAATRARLHATLLTREQTIGRGLFELFPDNPDDPNASGAANLRASLDRVLAKRASDTMAVQKYDIRAPDGTFQVKYWSPKNIPILSSTGEVRYILHRVEDVTELIRATEVGQELRDRTQAMEREVITRSRELADANRELHAANTKLADLDAAKTEFFSNVSHEFRTPLTLMLGPLEDCLTESAADLSPAIRERVVMAHDNALRLFKLVNALLDFSRLEAGRMRAHYAPLDVGTFTAELAGMFQSAVSRAGLRLKIDCPALLEPVWVDRDMWEKIVPNLMSNAFKFTHEGEISVRLSEQPSQVVLEVADTGVGIPDQELPRIFERFHRVDGQRGRTHEGTGIGLSLVRELVGLHGGGIAVESKLGRGTKFELTIPKGFSHLPKDAVVQAPVSATTGRDSIAHAAEAARWASETPIPPEATETSRAPASATATNVPQLGHAHEPRPFVLVVDDNADLRRYIAGLLDSSYEVSTAVDGQAGLEAIRLHKPDIVVSDVMMPRLDGVGMLRALRADPLTRSLPVILLSARAGEDAAIEGLDAGSHDYLVKPFSARELLARVRTHLEIARIRQAWIAELEHANRELDAFSYSVSHDLRAPLRAIDGFSRVLADSYTEMIDARGKDYLDRIRKGVQRMGTLIDDLLELSRIARAPLKADLVDLALIADEVVGDLRRAHPERSVQVDIAADLQTFGDRRLLQVVLVNLIGNAWKFTARVPAARILLGVDRGVTDSTFFVRDNGAGFDLTQAAKLFTPFQRLHSEKDFPGTGVGLATVARIVNRHGGRIWADATPGAGATFSFTLPNQPKILVDPVAGGPQPDDVRRGAGLFRSVQ